jgi:hypothetical protein
MCEESCDRTLQQAAQNAQIQLERLLRERRREYRQAHDKQRRSEINAEIQATRATLNEARRQGILICPRCKRISPPAESPEYLRWAKSRRVMGSGLFVCPSCTEEDRANMTPEERARIEALTEALQRIIDHHG